MLTGEEALFYFLSLVAINFESKLSERIQWPQMPCLRLNLHVNIVHDIETNNKPPGPVLLLASGTGKRY
jgi:hypothetical protein